MTCPAANSILIGNERKLIATFTDQDGNPADPTTITLKIKAPDGTVQTLTGGDLVNDSTGVYSYVLLPDAIGYWYWYWMGTGALIAAGQSNLQVVNSPIFE